MRSQRGRAPTWRGALAGGLLALSACGPRLHVESARLAPLGPEAGSAGRLEFAATYSGLEIDPRRPVRIHVGDDVRWVMLRPVDGASGVWAVEAPEQGYHFRLDVGRQRVEATEPTWPPRTNGMLPIALGQAAKRACSTIWLTPADGGWTFSGQQAHCR